jgi:hypothetical protein
MAFLLSVPRKVLTHDSRKELITKYQKELEAKRKAK